MISWEPPQNPDRNQSDRNLSVPPDDGGNTFVYLLTWSRNHFVDLKVLLCFSSWSLHSNHRGAQTGETSCLRFSHALTPSLRNLSTTMQHRTLTFLQAEWKRFRNNHRKASNTQIKPRRHDDRLYDLSVWTWTCEFLQYFRNQTLLMESLRGLVCVVFKYCGNFVEQSSSSI